MPTDVPPALVNYPDHTGCTGRCCICGSSVWSEAGLRRVYGACIICAAEHDLVSPVNG